MIAGRWMPESSESYDDICDDWAAVTTIAHNYEPIDFALSWGKVRLNRPGMHRCVKRVANESVAAISTLYRPSPPESCTSP